MVSHPRELIMRINSLVVSTFRRHHIRTVHVAIVCNWSETFVTLSVVIVCRRGCCFCCFITILTSILAVDAFSPAHVSSHGRRRVGIWITKIFLKLQKYLKPYFCLSPIWLFRAFRAHGNTAYTGRSDMFVGRSRCTGRRTFSRPLVAGNKFIAASCVCLPARPVRFYSLAERIFNC